MSIRVATVNFLGNTALRGENVGNEGPYFVWPRPIGISPTDVTVDNFNFHVEASPIYTKIEVRLRITGGPNTGFDETVTFTREPMTGDTAVMIPMGAGLDSRCGIDYSGGITLTSEDGCIMGVGQEIWNEDLYSFADAKKQRLDILGSKEFYFGDIVNVYPPAFSLAATPAAGTREASNKWGYGTASGEYVDTSAWSATKWRDYRGTYSVTVTSGAFAFGGSAQYDWILG